MVKFGLFIMQGGFRYEDIKRGAVEAEGLGYNSIWLFDHIHSFARKPTRDDILECWTTLSALSTITSKIRLGTLVLCTLFRNPALVAKMASTLDVISGGRVELGMGICGPSTPPELEAYGYSRSFPKRAERLQRLREAIQVIKALWTQDEASFQGRYYSIVRAHNFPKPLQKPHPRVWVGGEREDILRLAVELGDGWNCRTSLLRGFVGIKEKVEFVDSYCGAVGREPWSIKRALDVNALIAFTDVEVSRLLGDSGWKRGYLSAGLDSAAMAGTPGVFIRGIEEYVRLGVNEILFTFVDFPRSMSQVELFAKEVMPSFK